MTVPVSFAFVDGRPLFMDVAADSYFLLEPECELAFVRWWRSGASAAELQGDFGAIARAVHFQPEPPAGARPGTSALSLETGRSSFGEIVAAWRLLLEVRRALEHKPFALILAELGEQPRARGKRTADDTKGRLAARFARARRLAPVGGNCLSDSLALMRWMLCHGQSATLVFGAKLDPFAAHCWVEAGALLLNDHPDRVDRFTPIRAIACGPVTL